jgi:hypothetical protein
MNVKSNALFASDILRVFPRRIKNATPTDPQVRIGLPGWFDEASRVFISVSFSWDLAEAERLAKEWARVAPVEIGGPACGDPGEEFVPGLWIKHGYVITSRGCPNHCWFCDAWKREGRKVREFPIRDGYDVLDSNLLACSWEHFCGVIEMLKRQRHPAKFTGGLEPARLTRAHVDQLTTLTIEQLYLAYDTPDDWEPLQASAALLAEAGLIRRCVDGSDHRKGCFVLAGWPAGPGRTADTFDEADKRVARVLSLGLRPFANAYRDKTGTVDPAWGRWEQVRKRAAMVRHIDKANTKVRV